MAYSSSGGLGNGGFGGIGGSGGGGYGGGSPGGGFGGGYGGGDGGLGGGYSGGGMSSGLGSSIGGLGDGRNVGGGWGDTDGALSGIGMNPGGWADSSFGDIGNTPGIDATNTLSSMFTDAAPPAQENSFVSNETDESRAAKMAKAAAMQAVLSRFGILGQLAAPAVSSVMGVQTADQAAKTGMGTIGAIGGSMLGGPVGGLIGGYLGRSVANGPSGPAPSRPGGGGSIDYGQILGGLGQLYLNNKNAQDAKGASTAITSGVQSQLNDMFGQNSAYAQQLRQELARKDAASGRRSQYGPREVELQARLAEMQARTQPQLVNSMVGQQQAALAAQQTQRQRQAQTLSTLFQLGNATGINKRISAGIGGLFDGGGNAGYNGGSEWDYVPG